MFGITATNLHMAWEQRQQEAEAAAHAKALQHEHAARAAAEEAAAAAAARAGGELDALRAQLTSAAAQSEAALRVRFDQCLRVSTGLLTTWMRPQPAA